MALGIGAALIGSALIGGVASAFGQKSANDANQAASQAQMDFQERMSNTSYQRGMEDMREAGLNPILAYKQGGASSPTGQSYTAQNVGAAAVDGAARGTNTALTTKKAAEEIRLLRNQAKLLEQQGQKTMFEKQLVGRANQLDKLQKKIETRYAEQEINKPWMTKSRQGADWLNSILTPANSARSLFK